ncbi:sulfatase-like hydrolase/transferase [Halogeometricum luteum]|uniref:Sulfatase-like hydrolase/transferase n=1 Tax=Halogeometricum luteum TaxID=2950537 RepID=A0ABU2G3D5_9EURY|nr:sulfatase-like hydrolase/transferase [Halogeometricum sp. S3BR5-2]MDS0295301.1 sulfatase-like hydrolase/transferase [Halogeometricum sp. S3BR5-2]
MTRNIIVVCLDSVRKDYFDRHATRVRSMADVSVEQCRAASSWSVPSHASMITGQLPHQHGLHTHNRDFSTLPRERTLFEHLPREYHTAGISANVYAGPAYNFDRFFDTFVDAPRYQYFVDGLNATTYFNETGKRGRELYVGFLREAMRHDRPFRSLANGVAAQMKQTAMGSPIPDPMDDGAKLIRREALELLKERDAPQFLFLNFMEAHAPFSPIIGMDRSLYSVPNSWDSDREQFWDVSLAAERYPDYLRGFRELYAANIDYLDRVVSGLIEEIRRTVDRETTVLVTADHGENLGYPFEDGLLGHKSSLSESLLHVPLEIIDPPRGWEEPTGRFVSHLELPDLVCGLADGETPDIGTDRAVAEHVGLSPGPEPPRDRDYWDRMMRCAYEDSRKVVWDSLSTVTAYALDTARPCWQSEFDEDAAEAAIPEWTADWFDDDIEEYKQRARAHSNSVAVDDATASRLADLGYL